MSLAEQIVETTEVRRHNGECAYGPWLPMDSKDVPEHVKDAVADEVAEAMCRDMRREAPRGNTDEYGRIRVGGELWLYSR